MTLTVIHAVTTLMHDDSCCKFNLPHTVKLKYCVLESLVNKSADEFGSLP